jgi:predicted DCC family thiol-disulfide oxidoreductase YuxK
LFALQSTFGNYIRSVIVFYDGLCALCNEYVRWSLRHDSKRRLLFAALDSAHGTRLRRAFPATRDVDSIIVRDGDRVFVKSDAILAIARQFGGLWRLAAGIGRVVPRPLRDWSYDYIARRRYKWFGQFDACPLPPADARDRFLNEG